jgi:hypothetical protein
LNPVAVLLAASVLGNVALGFAWNNARDELADVRNARDQARGVASACSDATDDLRDLADEREAKARKVQDVARRTALAHEALAQQILSTPVAVPGDACASARVRIDRWLEGRVLP